MNSEKTASCKIMRATSWIQQHKRSLPWIFLGLWCLVLVMMRAGPNATVLNNPSSGSDYFLPLSGAWGMECGYKLHADLSSPLGVLYYAPYYWCAKLFGMTDVVVRYTQSVLLVVIAVVSFIALRPPRFSWIIAACATAYFSLYATSPCNMADTPFIAYEGVAYNRLAFVLGQIALLVALFPRIKRVVDGNASELLDAVLIAFLLTWVFFIKFNLVILDVFLISAGLLLSYFIGVKRSRIFFTVLFVAFAFFVVGVVFCFDISLAAMFRDLEMASLSRGKIVMYIQPTQDLHGSGSLTWGLAGIYAGVINRLYNNYLLDILCVFPLIVGGFAWAAARASISLKRLFTIYVFLGLLFLVDLLRPAFNSCSMAFVFLWIIALCFFDQFRPLISDQNGKKLYTIIFSLFICAVLLGTTRIFAEHAISSGYNIAAPRRFPAQDLNSPSKDGETIVGGYFGGLYIRCGDADRSGYSYAKRVNMAMGMLQKHGLNKRTIFDFDFINPFPMLLNSPYPARQPVWLDGGNTFNEKNHISPELLFDGSDVVLVPKQSATPGTANMLISVYGKYVQDKYALIDQNECWQLFVKRTLIKNK